MSLPGFFTSSALERIYELMNLGAEVGITGSRYEGRGKWLRAGGRANIKLITEMD